MKPTFIIIFNLCVLVVFMACNQQAKEETKQLTIAEDTISQLQDIQKDSATKLACNNDTLNSLANIISGMVDTNSIFNFVQQSSDFKTFSKNFEKRWMAFDSSRLKDLKVFQSKEISKIVKPQQTLFYPFSGPDILHAQTFFPEADQYIMIGLEPVGSFPQFKPAEKDSLDQYFSKINTSLNAILKFSFFRTASMSQDLKNTEVDGTLHLLVLFLKRTGNALCSAKPITIDSLGNVEYINSFSKLKKSNFKTKGIELKFSDTEQQSKTVYYFSLNAADGGLKANKGFVTYLKNIGTVNTYLKGASYLMHKNYFSIIRNVILNQSQSVIQDDSGIALHYFTENSKAWNYSFYGQYTHPIPMFSAFYQSDLDSLYQQKGSKKMGFGIGYNFRDKNSNFMIASKH